MTETRIVCPDCSGTGMCPHNDYDDHKICETCDGVGMLVNTLDPADDDKRFVLGED